MFAVTLTLAVLAAVMAAVTAVLVKWGAAARTRSQATVVLFLLAMMAAMFVGALIYYLAPGPQSLVRGLWVSSAAMSASVFPVFLVFLEEARARHAGGPEWTPPTMANRPAFVAGAIGLVLVNELLMGWTFQLADGLGFLGAGSSVQGITVGLGEVLVSPWFVFTMALEMLLSLVWLADRFPSPIARTLAFQPAVMPFSSPTFASALWVVGSAVAAGGVMAAALAFVLLRLYRGGSYPGSWLAYTASLFGVFGAMAAGLTVWALTGNVLLYSLSVALQMVVFLAAVMTPDRFRVTDPFPVRAAIGREPVPAEVQS